MSGCLDRKNPSHELVVDEVCWPASRRPINIPAISSSVRWRPLLNHAHTSPSVSHHTFKLMYPMCFLQQRLFQMSHYTRHWVNPLSFDSRPCRGSSQNSKILLTPFSHSSSICLNYFLPKVQYSLSSYKTETLEAVWSISRGKFSDGQLKLQMCKLCIYLTALPRHAD